MDWREWRLETWSDSDEILLITDAKWDLLPCQILDVLAITVQ